MHLSYRHKWTVSQMPKTYSPKGSTILFCEKTGYRQIGKNGFRESAKKKNHQCSG